MNQEAVAACLAVIRVALHTGQISAAKVDAQRAFVELCTELGLDRERLQEPYFLELAKQALRAFEKLTPEQQTAHRREQAIDWAWGEALLKYNGAPPITRERIGELYDELTRRGVA